MARITLAQVEEQLRHNVKVRDALSYKLSTQEEKALIGHIQIMMYRYAKRAVEEAWIKWEAEKVAS
jgi:exoribonuclease II